VNCQGKVEGAKPLQKQSFPPPSFEGKILKESQREAKPLLYKLIPLPLVKGMGKKGIGL
jgi:hypothetical protein